MKNSTFDASSSNVISKTFNEISSFCLKASLKLNLKYFLYRSL